MIFFLDFEIFAKMLFSTKKPQNWQHCKIGFINDCQIPNQRPKIMEVRYFLGFDIFC